MRRTRLKVKPEQVTAWQDRSRRRLRPVSPKKRRWLHDYAEARVAVIARAQGMCEAWLPGCTHTGTSVHHLKGRVGPDANHLTHLRLLCTNCHVRIHANPDESYKVGLMIRRNARNDG